MSLIILILKITTTHLLFLLTRRAHTNNPTRETTIPNPGAAGVAVAVTVVVTSEAAGSAGVSVTIGVDAGI
jgi:hypothetical protein